MIGLIRAELLRGLSRRLIRVLAILAALNFVVAGVIVFVMTDSDATVDAKRASAETIYEECAAGTIYPPGTEVPFFGFEVFEPGPGFEPRPGFGPGGDGLAPPLDTPERDAMCSFFKEQQLQEIRQMQLSSLGDITESLTALLTMIAILIGASLIGAEWSAKTIAVHLTWEPRRVHAYIAKAIAAVLIASGFFLLTQLLELATLYPSAALHGTTDVPATFWGDLFGLIGRGTVAAAVSAALGFAIASVTTSTVFALGFTFLVTILDSLVGGVVWRGYQRWSLFRNLGGYVSAQGVPEIQIDFNEVIPGRSPGGSGWVIVAYAIVLIASGTEIFRRRDIT